MSHEDFLLKAFDEAFNGMRNNKGGPFGAIVVRQGIIVGKGCNQVTSSKDPTAHAEIIAIRNACKSVNDFHLADSVLYTTCEPCPMCLSAIYWAKIKKVFYCSSRKDAEEIGFNDNHIYNELGIQPLKGYLELKKFESVLASELFNEWSKKIDKIEY